MTSPSNDNRKGAEASCPICNAAAVKGYAPFCSKRCADVDLHRWLSGGYAISSTDDDSEGAAVEADREG